MVQIPEFSLVIKPSPDITDDVAVLKKRLKDKIGWFGSANALAHITVFNFDADETGLEIWKHLIQQFCETIISKEVILDHFDDFPPKTFYIAANDESAQYINSIIADFHRFIGIKPNVHAHMSVARGLDTAKLEIAKMLFKDEAINFKFEFDGFVLRRFNLQSNQYSDIAAVFKFGQKI